MRPSTWACLWIGLALVGVPAEAFGLDQLDHAAITQRACEQAGFSAQFCGRIADENYNTDHHEFVDLAAHAQVAMGQSACEGLAASQQRMQDLGRQIREGVLAFSEGTLEASTTTATLVGRALHTIQDSCAHAGMTNAHHAWFSLHDSCGFTTNTSPDVQPVALTCAYQSTEAVFRALAWLLAEHDRSPGELEAERTERRWPRAGQVCAFLREASTWNGRDTRWNGEYGRRTLLGTLTSVMTSDMPVVEAPCVAGLDVVVNSAPLPPHDVAAGARWCLRLNTYCLGAGREDSAELAPPWSEAGAPDDMDPTAAGERGGCRIAAPRSSERGSGWWVLAAIVAIGRTRRRF